MKTIVLQASPTRKMESGSISTKLSERFLVEYKKNFPNKEIVEIDLNEYKSGLEVLTAEGLNTKSFFKDSDEIIELLKSADHLIVVSPMINFNVPATLKNFIDHIAVAGKTFKYKYDGNGESVGLLNNLTVQVLSTQGAPKGWYPFGDHVAYLEGTFNFLGMKVNKSILLAGTKTKEFNAISIDENLDLLKEVILKAAKF